jgi:hypothetical protein
MGKSRTNSNFGYIFYKDNKNNKNFGKLETYLDNIETSNLMHYSLKIMSFLH